MPKPEIAYDDDVQEILGKIPAWIVRWGISIVFIVLIGILIGCHFIRFPYVISAKIEISQQMFGQMDDNDEIHCLISVPAESAGQIISGQAVNVRLDAYPFMEYGQLEGNVVSIQHNQIHGGYDVEICLPKGLTSNYDKHFNTLDYLEGTCRIIIDDMTLLERFFHPVRMLKEDKNN